MSEEGKFSYLKALNEAQLKAATHDPTTPLQILAGPGSGKTRVLTSRVAYLIQKHGISPSQICAVTFTNKAANEMRSRLKSLVGEPETNALIMGTFHAICGRYLRRHGASIDLPNNFSICDADESKKIIAKILKAKSATLAAKSIDMKEGVLQSFISNSKAKNHAPTDVFLEAEKTHNDIKRIMAEVYEEYEQTLNKNNSLDFDDLLVYGVKLFIKAPNVLKNIRHILVDEFQDTSVMQYQLVKLFAQSSQCVSVVGDPDQSIYGWRSAEIANLGKMRRDFPSTEQIFLEENYRSTSAILTVSHAIVSQDKARIAKGLFTSHGKGSPPVLRLLQNEYAEGDFISSEIKRLIAYSGGILGWNDFSVLLRYNAISRSIEAAFQKSGIPVRMLAGRKFFDRAEIKDILAYLQLVDNPSFNPAFIRVVNVPKRSIGEKSIVEIEELARQRGLSCMEVAEKLVEGRLPCSTRNLTKLQKELPPFVKIIKAMKKLSQDGTLVPDLIHRLLDMTKYEDYLRHAFPDADSRWENVKELINFANEVSTTSEHSGQNSISHNETLLNDDGSFTEAKPQWAIADNETPLRLFLQTSSLSTDTETNESEQDDDSAKVTISTCHAAKGLEWPVVFVPAVEQGTFPFYRTEDNDEERRLLYVACTRAQAFLYITHVQSRMTGGETKDKERSEFVNAVVKKSPGNTKIGYSEYHLSTYIVEEEITKRIREYWAYRGPLPTFPDEEHQYDNEGLLFPSGLPSVPERYTASFSSAMNVHSSGKSLVSPLPPVTIASVSSSLFVKPKSVGGLPPGMRSLPPLSTTKTTFNSIATYMNKHEPSNAIKLLSAVPTANTTVQRNSGQKVHVPSGSSSGLSATTKPSEIYERLADIANVENPRKSSRSFITQTKPATAVAPLPAPNARKRLGMGRAPDGFGLQSSKKAKFC